VKHGNISGDTECQNNIKRGFSVTRYCRRCIPKRTSYVCSLKTSSNRCSNKSKQDGIITWNNV